MLIASTKIEVYRCDVLCVRACVCVGTDMMCACMCVCVGKGTMCVGVLACVHACLHAVRTCMHTSMVLVQG